MRARHTSRAVAVALGAAVSLALGACTGTAYWLPGDSSPGGGTQTAGPTAGDGSVADPADIAPVEVDPDLLRGEPEAAPVACPPAGAPASGATSTVVSTGAELTRALAAARPGSVIALADGRYEGTFTATAQGTADDPILLCAVGTGAVLEGGEVDSGYTLHLDGAAHWVLQGFAVRGGQKGVMLDATTDTVLRGLTVSGTGDEAVHFRAGSGDNLLIGSTISDTGLREERFGEGVYVGSAESNWCDVSACEPDRSDRNRVVGNVIASTSAESIDVKEGTTGGEIRGNQLDGTGMSAADSLLDVKGSGWRVTGNEGTGAPVDGAQVHVIVDGWGAGNEFSANTFALRDPDGFAVKLSGDALGAGNAVSCDNVALLDSLPAPDALSNAPCAS
ncbi:right-handed parallel beta-helix repeat-containing protein [Herbiconiux moechotypicola]|uniref:Right handed beta helix domain-containing protein n=1 Tax=Herbiconiux moechotypicola TaxID=637393 RepID=A0ABP5QBY8_9MICO|nr:right-handed parallel beta-helix repeat-containing protein [Herbiconiux moechotypicola]MCS5729589.1 right-handed parallel beta-helix repeat-containing protein [Herbiconiux moechotypicola]